MAERKDASPQLPADEVAGSDGQARPAARPRPAAAVRVPEGRLERAARWGMLAGNLAAGFVSEGARRLVRGADLGYRDLVFSPANAERMVESLGRMRGAAMKLGQALSLELDGIVPAAFADVLSALQASAQLHRVLGQAWGAGWRARLDHFDEEPFAAASIGQVHRARTLEGRELAVKVQFPGVARSIGSDVDNLAVLFRNAGIVPRDYDITSLVDEVRRGLEAETDYEAEAASMSRYADLVADDERLVVPRPCPELSTHHVLAMDYLEARPLSDFWAGSGPSQQRRDALGALVVRLVLRELFEWGFMQSDPNFANFLVDGDDRLVCLDFGAAIEVDRAVAGRYRELIAAGVRRDVRHIAELMRRWQWVIDEADEDVVRLAELVVISAEPLHGEGAYDFGASDMHERARDVTNDLLFRRGLRRPPPPELLFIQRKLSGVYLICARLGARVACAGETRRHLGLG